MSAPTLAPTESIRILLLEDNPADAELCIRKLESVGLKAEVHVARFSREFMERVRSQVYDLILTDYRLPDWNGLDAFHWLRSMGRDTPFVLVTGTLGDELAIECIKAGVSDYVLKENLERLPVAIRRALEEQKLRQSRDRAEEALAREHMLLRTLIDNMPDYVYGKDTNHRFLLANKALARRMGAASPDELLGKSDSDYYPPEMAVKYAQNEQLIMQSGEPAIDREDTTIDASTGQTVWHTTTEVPLRGENGNVLGLLGIGHIITERKRAEDALRRSVSLYRSMIESAPYGIYRVDQNGRIVQANRALIAMLGYETAEEVVGLDIAADIYFDHTERQRVISTFTSEGPSNRHETKWLRKDGKLINVRLAGRRLPDDDELQGGFEVFVEDITEQRSLQRQFEHAQKMEAVGRLAGGVAHDFNNLLMVISGYAQLMEELKTNNEKVSQYVTQIREASSRAANITRQLLAFSRKQVLEPTFLDLNYVVKDLCKMLPRLIGEDIEIMSSFDPHLGTVRADRGQLEQVIMNLVVNARDAMPKGGRLTLETANVLIDTTYHQRREISVPPGRYVLLSVSDTGVGMDDETQLHIFEPFFSTKEAGKGTGLGLATVYGIVKQSQGFIWVYSELGKGSSFKIYLPRLDAVASEQTPRFTQATPSGTETILLAEDETALRDVSRVYLASKGYTVLEADNANEALNLCKSHQGPIGALVTDMVMPGLGGLELAKSALKLRPGLAVVLVSGYTDCSLDTEVNGIGAKFLQKPYSLDALARTVRFLLAKNRQILIVEDSKFMRVAIKEALTTAGYSVNTVGDGKEGLRLACETKPDLVLLDAALPGLSGREVLRALKNNPSTRHIPVIVLTSLSGKQGDAPLDEGAASYLEKSDKLHEKDSAALIETVAQVLSKSTASNT